MTPDGRIANAQVLIFGETEATVQTSEAPSPGKLASWAKGSRVAVLGKNSPSWDKGNCPFLE